MSIILLKNKAPFEISLKFNSFSFEEKLFFLLFIVLEVH